jgi:hypothetical protein
MCCRETVNVIFELPACESARGPDADRHVKLLIQFAVKGSPSGAYSQPDAIRLRALGGRWALGVYEIRTLGALPGRLNLVLYDLYGSAERTETVANETGSKGQLQSVLEAGGIGVTDEQAKAIQSVATFGTVMFVPEHIAEFRRCYDCPPEPLPVEGRSPRRWFEGVDYSGLGVKVRELPESTNRLDLLARAINSEVCTLDLCISILAWGGMRSSHRDFLFGRSSSTWLEISGRIRRGELKRADAYNNFAELRARKELLGMGPAYFTKLIYFLSPGATNPTGYIMDQWVACSINLLGGRSIVKLDQVIKWQKFRGHSVQSVESIVSDVNTGQEYEKCCLAIEALSDRMGGWDPGLTELALIAEGGRNPHAWRAYVIRERLASLTAVVTE